MRFICPELDSASRVKDLCKVLNYKTANVEGNLYPILYASTDKDGENYFYGSDKVKKYLNVFHVDFVPRLTSEIATLIGLPVLTNFSATEALKRIVMSAGELLKLKTEAWITIFTDQDIRFYKPERLDSSKAIASYKIIERYKQIDNAIGFQGESSGSIFTDLVVGDTLNPTIIDSEVKNMIVNAYTASADLVKFTSGMSANPLDYINDKGIVYLVISKREDDGIYYYTGIRESKIAQTFSGGNVDNPNVRDGEWHYIGDPGEPAFAGAINVDESNVGKSCFKKIGNMVYLYLAYGMISAPGEIFTLPSGYRPLKEKRLIAFYGHTYPNISEVYVQTDGQVISRDGTSVDIYCSCSFALDNN